jgi:hypothetical protein
MHFLEADNSVPLRSAGHRLGAMQRLEIPMRSILPPKAQQIQD